MDLEKLMKKQITRKDFIKSIGFIILAILFFPRKALSFIGENSYIEQNLKTDAKDTGNTDAVMIKGIKAIEIIDD